MKLYHVSQSDNKGYDTFSDFVVCAESEEAARMTHPDQWSVDPWSDRHSGWCSSPDKVNVQYIGEAAENLEKGIVCISFHAG